MILAAATTNSLFVSPEAYHPEASKFPLFINLFGTMLGFFSCPIRSKEIILPKYGLRELEASSLKQVANNEFFKSLTVVQVHPQHHSVCWAI